MRALVTGGAGLIGCHPCEQLVARVVDRPGHTLEASLAGTERVLRAAFAEGAAVLLASSSEVDGTSVAVPLQEDADMVLGATPHARCGHACSEAVDPACANRRIPDTEPYEPDVEDLQRQAPDLTRLRSQLGAVPMRVLDDIIDRAVADARATPGE